MQKENPVKKFPCLTDIRSLYSKQVRKTTILKIFHNTNCASSYVTFLMEYILCNKQYVDKFETGFNIRMSNHQKDVKRNLIQ